jgi:sugar/nucleoside kinase (ribokinase family)
MTKDIQLCGLGNGLVDLQYEVQDIELTDLGLKKGEMLLVDGAKQQLILDKYKEINQVKCSGGSAANTVIAFSSLGGKSAYMTMLGKDEFGDFYSSEFKELGIELAAPQIMEDSTGTCIVFITPDSERTMHTSLAATGLFSENNINEDFIKRSEWLYIEGYKFSEESSTKAIYKALEIAKNNNTKVAVTFSDVFITDIFKDNLKKVVDNADLVFCNENEAKSYTGKDTIDEAYKALCDIVPNVVLTLGAEGSLIKWNGKDIKIKAYNTTPRDTTGAGDMYAGAFLYGIAEYKDPEIAGNLASFMSSKIVSQFGARLESNPVQLKEELLKLIESNK